MDKAIRPKFFKIHKCIVIFANHDFYTIRLLTIKREERIFICTIGLHSLWVSHPMMDEMPSRMYVLILFQLKLTKWGLVGWLFFKLFSTFVIMGLIVLVDAKR